MGLLTAAERAQGYPAASSTWSICGVVKTRWRTRLINEWTAQSLHCNVLQILYCGSFCARNKFDYTKASPMGRLWRDLWPQPFFAMPFSSESHLCMPQRLESEDAMHFGWDRIMACLYNVRSDTVPWQQRLDPCSKVLLLLLEKKKLPKRISLWAYQYTEDRASIWQAFICINLMRWSILLKSQTRQKAPQRSLHGKGMPTGWEKTSVHR